MAAYANVGDIVAGKYRVERILGFGGMGMVVAATHLELEQPVALKFMLEESLGNELARERFVREARAAAKLRSEHVCRVHDVGRLDSGAYFIVMELLEGTDFAKLFAKRAPLPIAEAVDLVLQAIEGVAEAHAHGIVHRDLKPENLFVTTANDGMPCVKVLDFGISKISGGKTRTGDVIGSPLYMSPEQMASSKDVDARADVWSLGVITYEALTGKTPVGVETLPAIVMAVMQGNLVPIVKARADLPVGLARAVTRCLTSDPARRFPELGSLAAALAPFGSARAVDSAARVERVLARGGRRASAPALEAPPPAAPPPAAPTDASTLTGVTTLQSAAGTRRGGMPVRRGRRIALVTGIALVALGGVIAGGTCAGRGAPTPAVAVARTPEPPQQPQPPPSPLASHAMAVDATLAVQAPADAALEIPAPAPVPQPADASVAELSATARSPNDSPAASKPPRGAHAHPFAVKPAVDAPAPAPPPEVAVDAGVLATSLDGATIRTVMDGVKPRLVACGDLSDRHGTVDVHVMVNPAGTVISAYLDDDVSPELTDCIISRVKAAAFPRTRTGGSFRQRFKL